MSCQSVSQKVMPRMSGASGMHHQGPLPPRNGVAANDAHPAANDDAGRPRSASRGVTGAVTMSFASNDMVRLSCASATATDRFDADPDGSRDSDRLAPSLPIDRESEPVR